MEDKTIIETRHRKRRRHRWAFPLGLAIIILAVVGAVNLINAGIGGIKNMTDDSSLKNEYEKFLEPVVANDPDSFDDLSRATMSQLIASSVQRLFIDADEGEFSEYYFEKKNDDGTTSYAYAIPEANVDIAFEELFGDERTPENMTVEGGSIAFTYDSTAKKYIVPLGDTLQAFKPKVTDIHKKGDSIILTVGYYSLNTNSDDWKIDDDGNYIPPEPNKYMKITLRDRDAAIPYYIAAIQASDAS